MDEPLIIKALQDKRAEISPLLANVYLHYVFDLWLSAGDGTRPQAI
jgi:hypothetical protein